MKQTSLLQYLSKNHTTSNPQQQSTVQLVPYTDCFFNRIGFVEHNIFQGCPFELSNVNKGSHLLYRASTHKLISTLQQCQLNHNTSFPTFEHQRKSVLLGSPGTGKSTTLYMLVKYCKENNWLILYIPEAIQHSFDTIAALDTFLQNHLQDNEEPLQKMNYNQSHSFFDKLQQCIQATSYESKVEQFGEYLQQLVTQDQYLLLIAIDQWNVFCNATEGIGKYFSKFSELLP